ncbi:hypothetical protein GCM10022393_25740 [Aquimarina addita]|uniref:CBM6 domain-containing protein n=1 Tax=Aquimarina addita TaxID=870485 RepID=A0ABP6ULB3_9FLAO
MKNICALLFIILSLHAYAADYYVSNTGSDTNNGTSEDSPFATIQHAVSLMQAGDTCYIRGGSYHEDIDFSGISGSPGNPIIITAYPGEKVILDGTIPITTNWTRDQGSIFKTTISEDVTQLFLEGAPMTLARFPNALVWSDEMWSSGGTRRQKFWDTQSNSNNGHVVDDPSRGPSPHLAAAGVSFNGCVAVMNFGNHRSDARLVSGHSVGSAEFDYSPTIEKYKTSKFYFFEGGKDNAERVMLDSAQEWAYDESTKTLYLWAPDGQNPTGRNVHGKTQTYAIVGNASTKHITIDGLNFFSTAFSFTSSDNITIQNCNFDYPTASTRALGSYATELSSQFVGSETDFCVNNVLFNCAFRYSDGRALLGSYIENMRVENNLFYHTNYSCIDASWGVNLANSRDLLFSRNTIEVAGPSLTLTTGQYGPDNGSRPQILEYNYLTLCSLQQDDGTAMYIAPPAVPNSIARYNWFINNAQKDFRWDGNGRTAALTSKNGNCYRNVATSSNLKPNNIRDSGYHLKGDDHEVYNNIGVFGRASISVSVASGGNANTVAYNNAADILYDDPMPGTNSNNFFGQNETKSMSDLLVDPGNLDFRPKPTATELIDKGIEATVTYNGQTDDVTAGFVGAAPDLGVYEYGASSYWIPGRIESKASMPIPTNGSVDIALNTDLMYVIGLNGEKALIYLGTDADNLSLVTTKNDPNNIVKLTGSFALEDEKTYYWRVDTQLEDDSIITGDIWSFSTGSEVIIPDVSVTGVNVSPENVSLSVGSMQQLEVTITPLDATNQDVSYTSSDTAIATVDDNGLVTAIGDGSATITVTTSDGEYTATSTILINTSSIGITVSPGDVSLNTGETQQLSTNKSNISYKSSNINIATVNSNGLVTAIGEGSATITVTDDSNGDTTSSLITVRSACGTYNISLIEAENYCEMSGIENQGENIGYINNNDWTLYKNINLSSISSVSVNASSDSAGGRIELRVGSTTGTILGTVEIGNTGGWNIWNISTAEVNKIAGIHDLYLVFKGGTGYLFDLDWISFEEDENQNSQIVHLRKRNAPDFAIDGDHGGENLQNIYLWEANSSNPNQRWIEIDRGNGYYSYQKQDTDFCIDGGNGGENGQNVLLWTCGDTNYNQHWLKVRVGGNAFKLVKRNASGFAINGGAGGANAQNVNLFNSASNGRSLQWIIEVVDDENKADNELLESTINIYPNPVNDLVNIEYDGLEPAVLKIVTISGQTIYSEVLKSNTNTIDLKAWSNGVYLVHIISEQDIVIKKLIKE